MAKVLSVEDAIKSVRADLQPPLLAIDGLPCAGKSTTVDLLKERIDFEHIYMDDFALPPRDWPVGITPAFPFPFIRYGEFLNTVQTLASTGVCTYRSFNWDLFEISDKSRTVTLSKPVVIDGVSSLNPDLCGLYGLRIFVESDRATSLQAAIDRGAGAWTGYWRDLFLPSVDIYMQTRPQERADLLIAGRGFDRQISN